MSQESKRIVSSSDAEYSKVIEEKIAFERTYLLVAFDPTMKKFLYYREIGDRSKTFCSRDAKNKEEAIIFAKKHYENKIQRQLEQLAEKNMKSLEILINYFIVLNKFGKKE